MEVLSELSEIFWSEKFWLPPNINWKDIEPGSHGINHADYRHLLWPIPLSIIIICARNVMDKYCFKPLGQSLGVRETRDILPKPNKQLEKIYRQNSRLKRSETLKLSKQVDWSEREVERWWRRRKAQDKPTKLKKFCETSWKSLFYFFNFTFGMSVLWDKPYLWDILHCAYDLPHHAIPDGIWWYYQISLSFYWSLTFAHLASHKRKDFWQMLIHHVFTLLLISLSWICNIHRVGSLVLAVHDCADIFLEAAKSLNYARYRKSCNVVFGVFTVVWIVTRLMMFPRIVYGSMFQSHQEKFWPMFYFFNSLLVGLLILHVIWTFMIFQVIRKSFQSGGIDDVRSSSEEGASVDESENAKEETNCFGVIQEKSVKNSRS